MTVLTVQQCCFSMLLPVANNADFVVSTSKFSNEMKFYVEPLY